MNGLKNMGYALMMMVALLFCGACDSGDDLMEIFNGKTWKLSRITTEGGKGQFYEGLWDSKAEEERSREALKTTGNFTLNFNLVEVNGETNGTAEAHGIRASINNATITIDGKSRKLTITGNISGQETDKLGRVFINGLLKVTEYEGDSNSLTLYFEDGNTTKVMGFIPQ